MANNEFGAALQRATWRRVSDGAVIKKPETSKPESTNSRTSFKGSFGNKDGEALYKQRQTQVEQANKDYKSNLFNMFGMGLAAQEAAGMPEQTELARYQRDYGLAAQEANQRSKELNKATDWEGRDELITRYREAQALANEDVTKENMDRANALREELEWRDIAAGNGARSYTGQDRFSNIFQGSLESTASGIANAAGIVGQTTGEGELRREAGSVEQTLRDLRTGDDTRRAAEEALKDPEASAGWQKVYDYADRIGETAAKDLQKAKEGLNSLGQAGVDIATNVIQMGFDAATGALTGGNSLVPMFIRTLGGAAQEARQDGATTGEQLLYGLSKAVIEVGTEKIADGVAGIYGKGAADDITEELIRKLSDSDTGRTMLRAIFGAAGEGGEEVLSDLLSPVAELIYKDPSLIKVDPSEVLYDFLIGAAVGALGGGTSIVTGQDAQKNAALRAQDALAQFNATGASQSPVQTQENTQTQAAATAAQETAEGPAETPAPTTPESPRTPLAQTILGSQESGWYGDATGTAQQAEPTAPTGPTTVPTTDLGKQSQTAETVRTSPVTNEETAAAIAEAEEAGGFNYLPITNDATMESAGQALQRNGFEHTLADWEKSITSGRTSASMVATGYLLFNDAQKQGNTEMAIQILSDLQSMNTTTAQALQINRMFQSLNPATRYQMVQRQIDKLSQKYSKQLPDGIQVSQELVEQYINAADENARDAALNQIRDEVASQLPSTWQDKFRALRYLNMLGNFRTQGRNIVGNIAMSAATSVKNAVQAITELALNKASGGKVARTTSLLVTDKALLNAAKADYDLHADAISGEGKYSDTGEKGFAKSAEDEKQIFKFKPLEVYRLATKGAMEKGDTIFIKPRYARTLAGYLQANGMDGQTFSSIQNGTIQATPEQTKLINEARNYATKEAQEATFHDNNKLSNWVSKLGRTDNTPKAVKVLSEGLMPFRKTPANVLARAVEYSPLGVANTLGTTYQMAKGEATLSDVINQASKTLTGTGLFALGMLLHNLGIARGKASDEDQEYFDQLQGEQDYSLKIPDDVESMEWIPENIRELLAPLAGSSVTADWLAPSSIPFFMGVALNDAIKEDGFNPSDVVDALSNITDPLLQMSMLQGVNDTLNDLSYADNKLERLAINLALSYLGQGLTNTMLGQAERSYENTRYSTFVDRTGEGILNTTKIGQMVQKQLGKASAKTPGLDYNQIEYVDAWGRTQSTGDNPLTRTLSNFLNPGYTSKNQSTEVDDELQRLYDNGNNNVFPERIAQSYQVNTVNSAGEITGKRNLTADEYVQFQKVMGQTSLEMVSELMDSALYRRMSDEARAKAISEIYSYAKNRAAMEVEPNTKPNDKAGTLSNPAAYYGLKSAISIATASEANRDYKSIDKVMQSYSEMPKDVQDALSTNSTIKHLSQAQRAGVGSEQYFKVDDAIKELKAPDGYKNPPLWQQMDAVMTASATDKEKDFFASEYFNHGENGAISTYEKYALCRKAGYRPEDVIAFYKIYTTATGTDKNNDGKADSGTKKKEIIQAAINYGYSESRAEAMYNMWTKGKWTK